MPTILRQEINDNGSPEEDEVVMKTYSESTFTDIDTGLMKKHFNIEDFEEKYGTCGPQIPSNTLLESESETRRWLMKHGKKKFVDFTN